MRVLIHFTLGAPLFALAWLLALTAVHNEKNELVARPLRTLVCLLIWAAMLFPLAYLIGKNWPELGRPMYG